VRPEGRATDGPGERHHQSRLIVPALDRWGPTDPIYFFVRLFSRPVPADTVNVPTQKAPPPPAPTQHELEADLWLVVSNRSVDKATALVALKNVTTALRLDMKIDTMSSDPDAKGKTPA